jgi:hypothetical protein
MRRQPTLLLPFLLLLAPAALAATYLQAPVAPPKRAHHSMVYDPVARRVLLTGGSTPINEGQSFRFFNDLWAWDGSRWERLGESGKQLSGAALAYDTRRQRVVSFGGYTGGASLGDLRVLEGVSWRDEGVHPSMLAAEPGFVYDSRRGKFVAFGGSAGRGAAHGRTWEYDGARWSEFEGAGPVARQGHVLVYDERRGRVVLFGGSGAPAAPGQQRRQFSDTWEFDGERWVEFPAAGPAARASAGVAYDSKRDLVILFGGIGSDGFLGDTWSWNGTEWRQLADTGPEPRAMGYLAYDAARERVVLFGGRKGYPDGDLNDTWEWDGARWTRRNQIVGPVGRHGSLERS